MPTNLTTTEKRWALKRAQAANPHDAPGGDNGPSGIEMTMDRRHCVMKTMIALFLLLMLATAAQAQQSESVLVMTGRAWILLPEMSKLLYVQGVKDGIMLASAAVDPQFRQQISYNTEVKGFFPGDYVKELDALFKDTENLPIPISLAYQHCTLKLKGTQTKEDLEKRLIELRTAMAK